MVVAVPHENPPLIYWTPEQTQISFHINRFSLLLEYFPLVVDVSHWWLNALSSLIDKFPDLKVIGLLRETNACARSFMTIKGYGAGSYNHWAPPGNGIWCSAHWDPTYPSYDLQSNFANTPDEVKFRLILRYIVSYNSTLESLSRAAPEKVKLVRTEDLSSLSTQSAIFRFIGLSGRTLQARIQ